MNEREPFFRGYRGKKGIKFQYPEVTRVFDSVLIMYGWASLGWVLPNAVITPNSTILTTQHGADHLGNHIAVRPANKKIHGFYIKMPPLYEGSFHDDRHDPSKRQDDFTIFRLPTELASYPPLIIDWNGASKDDIVFLVGLPEELKQVSALAGRVIDIEGGIVKVKLCGVNKSPNGICGCPLVNEKGKLVGIVNGGDDIDFSYACCLDIRKMMPILRRFTG